jgi:hypothetical protein
VKAERNRISSGMNQNETLFKKQDYARFTIDLFTKHVTIVTLFVYSLKG